MGCFSNQVKNKISILFSVFCVFFFVEINAQNKPNKLHNRKTLIDQYYTARNLSQQKEYAEKLIELSKKFTDSLGIAIGYNLLGTISEYPEAIKYLDSAITIYNFHPNNYQPASCLYSRGRIHYKNNRFGLALDDFISSSTYTKQNNDLRNSNQYFIAMLKNRIGDYDESKSIFLKILSKDSISTEAQLYSLFGVSDVFIKKKQLDSARIYNRRGLEFSKQKENRDWIDYFLLHEAYIKYHQKDYQRARLDLFEKVNFLKRKEDDVNLAQTYYYLGDIARKSNDSVAGLRFYSSVDSIFKTKQVVFTEIRKMYLELIEDFNQKEFATIHLYYAKQLNKLDSILNTHNVLILKNIHKKYDLPLKIAEKDRKLLDVDSKIENKNLAIAIISLLGIVTLIFFVFISIKNKKLKNRLVELVEKPKIELRSEKVLPQKMDLAPEVVNNIISGLADFENSKGYLQSNINSQKLAKILQTNTKYLSLVLNHEKGITYNYYINTLRINYCLHLLKEDLKYRNYTISAIAEECGYKTAESFSNSFKKITKVKPSLYIKELRALK